MPRAITFVLAVAPLANVSVGSANAQARDARFAISIPAASLSESLAALAAATGASFGFAGSLPRIWTRGVRGSMSIATAVRTLLAGTGLTAVPIGSLAFRIERARPLQGRPSAPAAPPVLPAADDIVVTGQKRAQSLSDVAMSLSVVKLDQAPGAGVTTGSREFALSVEGLALTNLGPGRNRQFIRGVADSPFNGPSQSTVAVQLDEARITFDAPDPDLRLVDVIRVEILKGPQGPLYGSGALGGIYRIVTRKPDLAAASAETEIYGENVEHGGAGGGGEAVLNLPLVDGRLGVRAVGYGMRSGGWIDDVGRDRDANVANTYGGRVALSWQPVPDWSIGLSGTVQYVNVADSQYVTASDDTLKRTAAISEPTDNDFRSVAGTVEGRLGALRVVSATSYIDHVVDFVLDASAAAEQFGLTGPARFRDDRTYNIFNQEVRLSPVSGGRWLVGSSFLRSRSHNQAVIGPLDGASTPVETLDRRVSEVAVFGEGTVPILYRLDATVGARLSRTIADDEATERAGGSTVRISKTILSPSVSLAWTPVADSIVFLRYARAVRPGGLAPTAQAASRRFESDELSTVDLGVRRSRDANGLSLSGSLFYTDWHHIQSDYLLANGLISTRNAGRGRIIGAEASADLSLTPHLRVSAGANLQDARLINAEDGIEIKDRRLPITPNLAARLGVSHETQLGSWRMTLNGHANYVGLSRLSFDENLDRKMGNYVTLASGATFALRGLSISARLDNLLDIKGDSFAFGNPFSIAAGRQYTPLRPRTVTLSIGRSW